MPHLLIRHLPGMVRVCGGRVLAHCEHHRDVVGIRRRKTRVVGLRSVAACEDDGNVDGVIEPHETRLLLRKSLHLLRDKQNPHKVLRKHGLTPL